MNTIPTLTGLSALELAALLGEPDRPSMSRARALLRWQWRPGATLTPLPERIEGLAHRALERLRGQVILPDVQEVARQVAADGTIKLLLSAGGHPIESVMIPGRGRTTVCVSSQSGCTRDCTFCATAKMGFRRNLLAGEIVAQVMLARAVAPIDQPVRNVVFMGMGEPLDNLDEVVRAVEALCSPGGLGLSPAHVTVSTSGVLPRMYAFVERCQANLAISINGSNEAQRREAMPIDRKWPLPQLLEFIAAHGERMFFLEYILMGGFNDAPEDAERLAGLLTGLNVRVNLIPFNPHPGTAFLRPGPERVQTFFDILNRRGLRTMIRTPRGDDIAAACGQLQRMVGESRAEARKARAEALDEALI